LNFVVSHKKTYIYIIIFCVNTQKLGTANHGSKRHNKRHNNVVVSTRQRLVLTISTQYKWVLTLVSTRLLWVLIIITRLKWVLIVKKITILFHMKHIKIFYLYCKIVSCETFNKYTFLCIFIYYYMFIYTYKWRLKWRLF
jgi:hypothetical protein